MSQLFIGSKITSNKNNWIYRGIYKQMDIAIKIISQLKEDAKMASSFEKPFTFEIALHFHLQHPNFIATSSIISSNNIFFLFLGYNLSLLARNLLCFV